MENKESRKTLISRTFNAPIDLMWKVWTTPEHLENWWGPLGFTSTIQTMDFQEGGEWNMTLHGPEGANYPNRSAFKEIIPLKKIVFDNVNPHFITTILFEPQGENTQIDWTRVFDTAEMREAIVKAHKGEKLQKQYLEKLEKHLSAIPR